MVSTTLFLTCQFVAGKLKKYYFSCSKPETIPNGVQLRLQKDSWEGVLRIYETNEGKLHFDYSQITGEHAETAICILEGKKMIDNSSTNNHMKSYTKTNKAIVSQQKTQNNELLAEINGYLKDILNNRWATSRAITAMVGHNRKDNFFASESDTQENKSEVSEGKAATEKQVLLVEKVLKEIAFSNGRLKEVKGALGEIHSEITKFNVFDDMIKRSRIKNRFRK